MCYYVGMNDMKYTAEELKKIDREYKRTKNQESITFPLSDYIINGKIFSGRPTAKRVIKTDSQGRKYVRFDKTIYLVKPQMIECDGELYQNGYDAEGV